MYYEVFKESWIPSGLDHPEGQFGSLFRTGPGVVIGPLSRSKGHRVVMIKLLLIAALFLTSASAQNQDQKDGELSLVELARLERDRRAHLGKPDRIITNADLKEFKGKVSSSVAVLDPAEEKKDKVEKAKEQVVEAPKEINYDLGTWQDLFTSAKLKLGLLVSEGEDLQDKMTELINGWTSAKLKLGLLVSEGEDLQDKMTELINGWIRVSNGQVEAPPERQMQDTEKQLDENRQDVSEARQFLQDLQQQARQKGLPPGTIRELLDESP